MKKAIAIIVLGLLMTIACSDQNQLSCIEGDCINGYGTSKWADGGKYVGEYKDGKKNIQRTST